MNPWYAKTIILLASVALVAIRAPHGRRSRTVPVARSRKGATELIVLVIAWLAYALPLVWVVASRALAFANYPLRPIPLVTGSVFLVLALWLLYRSHADLGT